MNTLEDDLEETWYRIFPFGNFNDSRQQDVHRVLFTAADLDNTLSDTLCEISYVGTPTVWISNFYVKREVRGNGVGKKIIFKFMKVFKKHGITKIVLSKDMSGGFWRHISKTPQGKAFKWEGIRE